MKKALLAVGIGVVSFLVGLIGFVFFLPSVAPGRAEEAKSYLDSLEAVRLGLVHMDGVTSTDSSHTTGAESGHADTLESDTSSGRTATHTTATKSTESSIDPALRDSLQQLSGRLRAMQAENQALRRQLEQAQKAAQSGRTSAAEIASLTETLTKLDDKELKPILQQLDGDVLEQLYRSTSGRTQARLLQAMPPERAAHFVQNLVRGSTTPGGSQSSVEGTPTKAAN